PVREAPPTPNPASPVRDIRMIGGWWRFADQQRPCGPYDGPYGCPYTVVNHGARVRRSARPTTPFTIPNSESSIQMRQHRPPRGGEEGGQEAEQEADLQEIAGGDEAGAVGDGV